MREIELTQNLHALVDDADFDTLNLLKWCAIKTGREAWYAKNKNQYMHCVIMGSKNINHINGNGLDNRRSNLRKVVTNESQQTRRKSKSPSSSKYKGVSYNKWAKKWSAYISTSRKQKHLGYFEDQETAAIAYNEAAKERFGKFARLNEV